MENFTNILKFIFSFLLGAIGIYLIARLVVYAAAKSWYQAKRNEEENQNGEKKEKIK
jgi:hypothetical protein